MRNRNTIYQIKPIYENDSGDDYTIMASNRLLKNWSVQDRLEPFYSTQEKARKTISEIHTILTNDMMSEIKNFIISMDSTKPRKIINIKLRQFTTSEDHWYILDSENLSIGILQNFTPPKELVEC